MCARFPSTRRASAPSTPMSPSPSATWPSCYGHEPAGRGRAADAACACHRRKSFGPEHPNVASRLNNLARLLAGHEPAGRGRAALSPRARHRREELRSRASRRRHPTQQPWPAAAGHQPAAEAEPLIAARSPSTRKASVPNIPTSPATSTTWPCCCRPPTGLPRPSR